MTGLLMSMRNLIEEATYFKHTTSFWLGNVDFTMKADVEKSVPLTILGLIINSERFLLATKEALYYRPGPVSITRKCSGIGVGDNRRGTMVVDVLPVFQKDHEPGLDDNPAVGVSNVRASY
jgi:hypothetical protein